MTVMRSGALVAWANAFLDGREGLEPCVDAVTGSDAAHRIVACADTNALPYTIPFAMQHPTSRPAAEAAQAPFATLWELLHWLRRRHAAVRLVLPVAGDVRGLGGSTQLRTAALDAGAAVLGPDLALVPRVVSYAPSSAPDDVCWQWFAAATSSPPTGRTAPELPTVADVPTVAEAQYELTEGLRECAATLRASGVAGRLEDPVALADARRAGDRLNLPHGHPSRAVALLAQAQRLHAVLAIAVADPAGGAVDRYEMTARESALRPLSAAVRRALVAAFSARP